MLVIIFNMPLYKAWGVGRRKRKSVIADSFYEFVVNGELNSVCRFSRYILKINKHVRVQ